MAPVFPRFASLRAACRRRCFTRRNTHEASPLAFALNAAGYVTTTAGGRSAQARWPRSLCRTLGKVVKIWSEDFTNISSV